MSSWFLSRREALSRERLLQYEEENTFKAATQLLLVVNDGMVLVVCYLLWCGVVYGVWCMVWSLVWLTYRTK